MNHALTILAAFLLDAAIGDPRWLPHPVVAIGNAIAWLERVLRRIFSDSRRGQLAAGCVLVLVILTATGFAAYAVLALARALHPWCYWLVQTLLGFSALACRGLRQASGLVRQRLAAGDLPGAREAVGRIVGRDTEGLDNAGVARAAVESVAENASDGVIAPLLYFALGGGVLAWLYKAINTMDSMIGYKNERFLYFGRCAARLDDIANFIPARLTALLLLLAAWTRGMDWRGGWRIFRRDRRNHSSPNSAQPEAACAGILGVQLGGDASYHGIIRKKPTIGDPVRNIEAEDIARVNGLVVSAAWLAVVACVAGALA